MKKFSFFVSPVGRDKEAFGSVTRKPRQVTIFQQRGQCAQLAPAYQGLFRLEIGFDVVIDLYTRQPVSHRELVIKRQYQKSVVIMARINITSERRVELNVLADRG